MRYPRRSTPRCGRSCSRSSRGSAGKARRFDSYGSHGYIAHRLTGGFVGTGTVIAIGYLGRRVGGARVGLLAAGIAATYPVLITADGSLLTESLFGLCVAVAMLLAYRLLDPPSGWWAADARRRDRRRVARPLRGTLAPSPARPSRRLAPEHRPPGSSPPASRSPALASRWRSPPGRSATRSGSTGSWSARRNNGSLDRGRQLRTTYHGRNIGLWDFGCVGVPESSNEAMAAARQRRKGLNYARDALRPSARRDRRCGSSEPGISTSHGEESGSTRVADGRFRRSGSSSTGCCCRWPSSVRWPCAPGARRCACCSPRCSW